MEKKYNRVLIKLSGEAIGKEHGRGIDNVKLEKVVNQIIEISKSGTQIALVIGGGNFWRGRYGDEYMEKTTSHYMGMLATVLNALAFQEMGESKGLDIRTMTSIEMKQIAEPYIRRRAIRHLEKGRVVLFAGGTGNPFFTTDSCAALRAIEIDADIILLDMQSISEGLNVMDTTAITLCMENKKPICVFALNEDNSIIKAISGEKIGTIIRK